MNRSSYLATVELTDRVRCRDEAFCAFIEQLVMDGVRPDQLAAMMSVADRLLGLDLTTRFLRFGF